MLPSGRVAGDRVLAFRFADAPVVPEERGPSTSSGRPVGPSATLGATGRAGPGRQWLPKTNYAVLANTAGIARAKLKYDETFKRLSIDFGDGRSIEARLNPEGRQMLEHAVASYMMALPGILHGHPEKLPLKLVGDLDGDHFHDNAAGRVTLHSMASLRALGRALADPTSGSSHEDLDGRRFRSNIVIEGVQEWEEFSWVGRRVRIGPAAPSLPHDLPSPSMGEGEGAREQRGHSASSAPTLRWAPGGLRSGRRGVEFEVVKTNVRCLATHANPVTGERDCDIMNTLTRVFGQEKPQFAVSMQPVGASEVCVGDEVTVV